MSLLNSLIDTALAVGNILSIKENHTEAKSRQEREEQKKRRQTISDVRNAAFLLKRFIR